MGVGRGARSYCQRIRRGLSVTPAVRSSTLAGSASARQLRLEQLEARRVLATIVVTTAVDHLDTDYQAGIAALPGPDGEISLREAILAANYTAGKDVIEFDEAGVFQVAQLISLENGRLDVTDELEIRGPGAGRLRIDGAGHSRVFHINDGQHWTPLDVTLQGVEVTGGVESSAGGAIYSNENLSIADSRIAGNHGHLGGGIYASGSLNLN